MELIKNRPVKLKESLLEKVVLKIIKSKGFEIDTLRIKQVIYSEHPKYNFLKTFNPNPFSPKVRFVTKLDKKTTKDLFNSIILTLYQFLNVYCFPLKNTDFSDFCFIVYIDEYKGNQSYFN